MSDLTDMIREAEVMGRERRGWLLNDFLKEHADKAKTHTLLTGMGGAIPWGHELFALVPNDDMKSFFGKTMDADTLRSLQAKYPHRVVQLFKGPPITPYSFDVPAD